MCVTKKHTLTLFNLLWSSDTMYCRVWSRSPMTCEKHGPRDSVEEINAFSLGIRSRYSASTFVPRGMFFTRQARETQLLSAASLGLCWAMVVAMENFEKCTFAMLRGPCSQDVMGNTPWLDQLQNAINRGEAHEGTYMIPRQNAWGYEEHSV